MLRVAVFIALLVTIFQASAQAFRLPFDGQWFVLQGGDTLNVNQHMAVRAQWFGVDFAKLGGLSKRELARPNPAQLEDFYSWGEPVLAPHDGVIVTLVNDLPDNPLGTKDTSNLAGNHVVIETAPNQFVFLAHFQRGTIAVKAGERVKSGQPLGKCGNSGNSDYPHIHMHVQDQPIFNVGNGQNPIFMNIDVKLNGKELDNVMWPLIRGLFVTQH